MRRPSRCCVTNHNILIVEFSVRSAPNPHGVIPKTYTDFNVSVDDDGGTVMSGDMQLPAHEFMEGMGAATEAVMTHLKKSGILDEALGEKRSKPTTTAPPAVPHPAPPKRRRPKKPSVA